MDENELVQANPQTEQPINPSGEIPIKNFRSKPLIIVAIVAIFLLITGLSYYLGTQRNTITNSETVPSLTDTPSVTDTTSPNSATYSNKAMGYSIQIPLGWIVKEDSSSYGPASYLLPESCQDEFANAKKEQRGIKCTHIVLPQNIGASGWGNGNNRQESAKINMPDGFTSERSTFYYDDNEYVSWNMSSAAAIPTAIPEGGIYVFATVYHQDPSNASLKNVYEIVESIYFSK